MAIVGVTVAVMILGFWFYYKNTQKRLEEASAAAARQEMIIEQQKAIQEQIQKDIEHGNQLRQEVNRTMQQTQRSVDDMRSKFTPHIDLETGKSSTLGQAAVEKTDTIQKAVNRGTYDQLRCFELITGSPLSEDERNGKKTNNICPELLIAPAIK
jgi:type II secretory pathway pseudopilin PulG